MLKNSKTKNVTKLKNPNITKMKISKCDKNLNLNKTKLKSFKFEKPKKKLFVTKRIRLNCGKKSHKLKLSEKNLNYKLLQKSKTK